MVFFNCNSCGESVKKNQVEKHYRFKCTSCSVLSCVDCGKDFPGDTYKDHVKCMTEDQKYGGKNYEAKPNANKGERKQENWVDQVQQAIDKVTDQRLKRALENIKGYSNIPRKKNKFMNFLKSSVHMHGAIAERAWDAISAEVSKQQQCNEVATAASTSQQPEATENGSTDSQSEPEKKLSKRERKEERQKKAGKAEKKDKKTDDDDDKSKKKSKKRKHQQVEDEQENDEDEEQGKRKKKKKKRKAEESDESINEEANGIEEEEEEESPPSRSNPGKFNWEGIIVGFLKRADDHELSVKKLKKKVFAAYHEHGSVKPETEQQLIGKFNKKINKNPKFKVHKDCVKLK